jgi:hypothetical protein
VAKHVSQLLDTPERPDWMARGHALIALQKHVHACLPASLKDQVRVSRYTQGIMFIGCASPAVATRLRQDAAQLASALRACGLNVQQIHAQVLPAFSPRAARKPSIRTMDANSRERISRGAEKLPPGKLRELLKKMAGGD